MRRADEMHERVAGVERGREGRRVERVAERPRPHLCGSAPAEDARTSARTECPRATSAAQQSRSDVAGAAGDEDVH